MIIYMLIMLIVLLLFIHIVFNYNYRIRLVRKLPGPKTTFIVGHTLEAVNVSSEGLFKKLRIFAKRFDGIYGLHAFLISAVCIYSPEDVEIITSNVIHNQKGYIYNYIKPWLQEGLLISGGHKWQQRRKILTPAFHFSVLRKYFEVFKENSRELLEKLETLNDETVDLIPFISEFTLNTICESTMGVKLMEEISDFRRDYKRAIHQLGQIIVKRIVTVPYAWDLLFNFFPIKNLQKQYISMIHNFSRSVIEKRRKMLENNNNEVLIENNENCNYYNKDKRSAMLDLLLSAEKDGLIDQAGIQEEVDTFMFEGHDTVSVGLTFCLLSLANEPFIQEKVYREQIQIFGKEDREITMKDLSLMRYLDLCIKESLRLYPPVPLFTRKLTQNITLSNYTVPKGTMCVVHVYDLHRREDIYKNASQFEPERFLPENSEGRHHYAYIPFSAGSRNCIGQKFAMIEMKSLLSFIIRNFKLVAVTKPEDVTFLPDLVLRSKGPIYVKFVKRK